MSRNQRLAVIAAFAAAAVVAFIVLKPGDDSSKSSSTAITIVNGKPKGGIQKIKVKKGDQVRFEVVSDTADEIHVHGYDFKKNVAKGGTVSFDFPAKIDGVFDIELEGKALQIAELTVEP